MAAFEASQRRAVKVSMSRSDAGAERVELDPFDEGSDSVCRFCAKPRRQALA